MRSSPVLATLSLLGALLLSGCASVEQRGAAEPDDDSAPFAGATPAPAPLPDSRAADVVLIAMNYLDTPYRRGGTTERGFDCSGFTRHVFDQGLNFPLPRTADDQAVAPGLVRIRRADLQPGDLVFFNTLKRTFSHVGIYIGDGRFIHAPRTGAAVRVEPMDLPYWKTRFTGARRVAVAAASG